MKPQALLITFLLFLFCGTLWHVETQRLSEEAIPPCQDFFPGSLECQKHASSFPYIEAWGSQKNLLGYIVRTDKLYLNITGYAGPTPLILALNPDGKIINLRALPNNETPSYVGHPEMFLKQFLNASSAKTLKVGVDVDAITRATITSEAMTATIQETLRRFSREILKQNVAPRVTSTSFNWSKVILPLILLIMASGALFAGNTPLRWIALLSGFVYFGLMTQTMLSIIQIANIGLENIPNFISNPLWFMTLGIALCSSLIIGRIYCGSLCPFAFPQEILNKTVRHSPFLTSQINNRAKTIKYFLLFLILGICFMIGNPSTADMEPFVTLFAARGTKLAWGLVGLMLTLAIFYHRFWCAYLCPVGAVTGLFARISFFKIKADPGCTRCGICAAGCPTRAIEPVLPTDKTNNSVTIDESECLLCGKCLNECPGKHLKLTARCHDWK